MAAGTYIFGDVFSVDSTTDVFGYVFLVGANPVGGPFCVEAVDEYASGDITRQSFTPDAITQDDFSAGSTAAQGCD